MTDPSQDPASPSEVFTRHPAAGSTERTLIPQRESTHGDSLQEEPAVG
jgi:hypothetical protein